MSNSILSAIFHHQCPRCRKACIYKYSAFNLLHYAEMHKNCPHCSQHFEPEPGFYYGAMFVSYVISVAVVITSFLGVYWGLNNPSLQTYFVVMLPLTVLMMPLNFRYSRTLMLYLFGGISYQKKENKL